MTVPAQRKKTFAHKVRTGCQRCKNSRVKCDEAKPDCVRCQRRGLPCFYQPVQTWLFEPGKPKKKAQRALLAALGEQPASPQAVYSHEEGQALRFFVSRTGAWMAEHQAVHARDFWVVTLPRMFHAVPATRHLITALGLLEMPTASTDDATLDCRSQRITSHYVKALHEMTKPARHAADITLSAILAWLLEAFMNHGQRAAIPSSAAQQLSYDDKKEIPPEELEIVLADVARARCQRFRCDVAPSDSSYVLDAVRLRNRRTQILTAADIRTRFEDYYANMFPNITDPDQISAAEAMIGNWESAILINVYRSDEPTVVWSSLHFLCVLSTLVLPIQADIYFPDLQATELGLDFVLEKCELVLSMRLAGQTHQQALSETARLMVDVLTKYTPDAWLVSREERLLRAADHCYALLWPIEHALFQSLGSQRAKESVYRPFGQDATESKILRIVLEPLQRGLPNLISDTALNPDQYYLDTGKPASMMGDDRQWSRTEIDITVDASLEEIILQAETRCGLVKLSIWATGKKAGGKKERGRLLDALSTKICTALRGHFPGGFHSGQNFGEGECFKKIANWFAQPNGYEDNPAGRQLTHRSRPFGKWLFWPVQEHLARCLQKADLQGKDTATKVELLKGLEYAVDVEAYVETYGATSARRRIAAQGQVDKQEKPGDEQAGSSSEDEDAPIMRGRKQMPRPALRDKSKASKNQKVSSVMAKDSTIDDSEYRGAPIRSSRKRESGVFLEGHDKENVPPESVAGGRPRRTNIGRVQYYPPPPPELELEKDFGC